MLEKAFDCELVHHIRHLASLSPVFPFYRMTWASTADPTMMFADAAVVDVAAVGIAAKSMHFAVVVGIAATVAAAAGNGVVADVLVGY